MWYWRALFVARLLRSMRMGLLTNTTVLTIRIHGQLSTTTNTIHRLAPDRVIVRRVIALIIIRIVAVRCWCTRNCRGRFLLLLVLAHVWTWQNACVCACRRRLLLLMMMARVVVVMFGVLFVRDRFLVDVGDKWHVYVVMVRVEKIWTRTWATRWTGTIWDFIIWSLKKIEISFGDFETVLDVLNYKFKLKEASPNIIDSYSSCEFEIFEDIYGNKQNKKKY